MPSGIQTFDPNGNVTLDTNDRLTRFLGWFTPSAPNGYVDIPEFANPGNRQPWYTVMRTGAEQIGLLVGYEDPTIIVQGGRLSWVSQGRNTGDARQCVIIYGDY